MNYIKGNYRQSIFKSSSGYVIGLFKIKETNDEAMEDFVNKTITFTGYFAELNLDDTYLFYGELVEHPKYGTQYQVNDYERVKIEDKEGLVEFLSSDMFPGVGLKMAHRIVDTLGEHAIDKILENPDVLLEVPKLSTKVATKIVNVLSKYDESHNTILYLTELGFVMKDAMAIYNKYKQNTISKIEYNIYELVDDVEDVTFNKVDNLRSKLNITNLDDRRIKACIIYIMKNLTFSNGDTYLYFDEIFKNLINYINEYIAEEKVKLLMQELSDMDYIVIKDEKYYLYDMYYAECNIANQVLYFATKEKTKYKKLDKYLEDLQKHNTIDYSPKQKEAIIKALENNITIITGGPGTGKTTIIKAITSLYEQLNNYDYDQLVEKIALLAPTGRASKRMSESTFLPAMTIHRFLKWDKDNNKFGVNEDNKEFKELVIVDEVSMIDLNLMDALLKGLTNNIKLILVGDIHQLPSVGPGQILKDLIDSNIIETVYLDLIYRTDENSYINTLASEIKDGIISDNILDEKSDFKFLMCNNLNNNLINLANQINKKDYNYKKVQIMAPMYKGESGIDNLNKQLQDIFNPKNSYPEVKYGDVVYRVGDKVIQLVNMPDDNIFNGDIGIITNITLGEKNKYEIDIDFDGNVVKFIPKNFNKFKHAYIISIHKSQGSEFDLVVIPFSISYKRMLYRKLIYTAITRAKKKLILIGDMNAFRYGVNNANEYIRKTSLIEKINQIMNNNL